MRKNVLFIIMGLLLLACQKKKEEPITITGWERYQNQYTNLSFNHPQGWFPDQDGRSIAYYSSQDVVGRFSDLTSKGKNGAKLMVTTQKMDSLVTLEDYMNQQKTDLTSAGFEITAAGPKTISNLPGIMLQYNGFVTNKAKLGVAQVCTMRDSFLYTVKFEAFDEAFESTKQAFDSVLTSLILPEKKVAPVAVDPSIPAEEFKNIDNKYLKIAIPSNFDADTPKPKAPTEFSLEIRGYRQDCYIRIDVIPAPKLSAEKVIEQNSKYFKSTSKGKASIDGIQTKYLNYSPMKGIQSRVYFLVKNDKFYRIIINYYGPMRSTYLQPFEKTVASIIAK